jgi:hypothetical protein
LRQTLQPALPRIRELSAHIWTVVAQGVRQANRTIAPEPRMDPAHVGNAVVFMATKMPFVGRG